MPELTTIPAAFVALHREGRFDYWGAPYKSLSAEQRQARMKTHLAQVLWWRGIEWDRSPDEILSFQHDPDGWMRPGLIPFAGDGSGDEYCWYPAWQTGAEPPVVFFVHDDTESYLFAADFSECLTRCLLRSYASRDEERDGPFLEQRPLWDAHLAIISPHLKAEHQQLLGSVTNDFSRAACEAADQRLAKQLGTRTLIGGLEATDHSGFRGDQKALLRLYDDSIKYWRELVESEGRTEFAPKLAEVLANREAAANPPKAKPELKAKTKPKAKPKAKPRRAKKA